MFASAGHRARLAQGDREARAGQEGGLAAARGHHLREAEATREAQRNACAHRRAERGTERVRGALLHTSANSSTAVPLTKSCNSSIRNFLIFYSVMMKKDKNQKEKKR